MLSRRVALTLVGVGVLIRLTTLGRQSLWLDEAFGVWAATAHDAHTIWTSRLDPNEPALFYLVLHYVLGFTGVSEAAARLPAALTSIAGIGLAWWLGRTVWPGTGAGRLAAALVALAPIDLWFAQEARMHGMVGAASLAFALGLWINRPWAALLLVTGLAGGLMLDHTMWPVALATGGVWSAEWWRAGRPRGPVIKALAGIVVAMAIYTPVWPEAVDLYARLDSVASIANLRRATGLATITVVPLSAALLFAITATTVAAALWQRILPTITRRLILAVFLLGTTAMAIPRVYGLKQIVVCGWPLLTVLAAGCLSRSHRPRARLVPLAWSVAILIITLTHSRADWRGAAAYLRDERPEATVVLDPASNQLPYHFYRPGAPFVEGPVRRDAQLAGAAAQTQPVCLIAPRFGSQPPTTESEEWLDGHFTLEAETRFSRLAVRCYRRP